MIQLPLRQVYVIDTSSFVELDGRNRAARNRAPPPPSFSPREQTLIWQGIEELAKEERLKLLTQVKKELARRNPSALQRLKPFPGCALRTTNQLRLRVANLLTRHRGLVPPDPTYDPADAWLIAAALEYGYAVVTEELASSVRKTKKRRGIPIPDVCHQEGVACMTLRELANDEGWLT